MADVDSRYNIEVKLTVTDVTTGQVIPDFSDVILHQYNLTYESMQGFQKTVTGTVLGVLAGIGDQFAEEIKGKRAAKK